jgi:Tfp pilus assembly protein PilO
MKNSKMLVPILFVVLILVVAYVAYSMFFAPLWEQNQQLRQELDKEGVHLANLTALDKFKPDFDTKAKLYQERLAVLGNVLPSSLDKMKFLLQMQNQYQQQGLKMEVLPNPSPPTQVEADLVSNFQLQVRGNYFKVLSFLKSLLNFRSIIRVNAISMAGGDEVTATLDCSMYLKPGGGA